MLPWTPYHPHQLDDLRQLAAQLLGLALREVLPGRVHALGGRVTHSGFAFDCVPLQPLNPGHLEALEFQMHQLVQQELDVRCCEMQGRVAGELFRHHGEPRLAQIADDQGTGLVDLTYIGEAVVLGRVDAASTKVLRAFKLVALEPLDAGGIRIVGTAMPSSRELRRHLKMLASAPNHERLGAEFFRFEPSLGKGSWYWLPKGAAVRQELLRWWQDALRDLSFQPVNTPHFPAVHDYEENHRTLYRMGWHSYRELPLRLAEVGPALQPAYDHLWGLLKASSVTADSASVFCTREQLEEVLHSSLQFLISGVKMLGFENPLLAPKENIDRENAITGFQLIVKDRFDREWWGPCVKVEQRGGRYQDSDGVVYENCSVHLTFFGALERSVAVLLEHFDGRLPLWLAPEQVRVIPVADRHLETAGGLQRLLSEAGLKAGLERRSETLSGKVRAAQLSRVPYTVVVGDAEGEDETVAVRSWGDEKVVRVSREALIESLREEIASRRVNS